MSEPSGDEIDIDEARSVESQLMDSDDEAFLASEQSVIDDKAARRAVEKLRRQQEEERYQSGRGQSIPSTPPGNQLGLERAVSYDSQLAFFQPRKRAAGEPVTRKKAPRRTTSERTPPMVVSLSDSSPASSAPPSPRDAMDIDEPPVVVSDGEGDELPPQGKF